MPPPVSPKFEAWLAAVAVGLLTTTTSIDSVRAGDDGSSLAALAGSYVGRQGGFLSLCSDSAGKSANCANPSSVVRQFNDTEVIRATLDEKGHFCSTDTDVFSPVGGSKDPAEIIDFVGAGLITSYDQTTGKGKSSVTIYAAADGVSCKGATVAKPRSAQPVAQLITDFTAGEAPALHTDDVYRSFTSVDGSFGGAVLGNTLYIQHE